jgi:RarD protein
MRDNPLLGILLMLGFCIVAPLGDAVAKMLSGSVGIVQLVLVRFTVQVFLLAPFIWITGRAWRMPAHSWHLVVLRTVLHVLGIGMMVSALAHLELADAVAIAFVMPFIMLFLGKLFLKEEVGARRILASIVGFGGTLLVIQPAFEDVGYWALLPVGVAINFAFFMLITRRIAKDVDPISMQAVSGGIAMLILVPVVIFGSFQTNVVGVDLGWRDLDAFSWGLLALLGIFGTVAHLLMTWSLRYAPSATLAPMQYLEIPFATAFGFLLFGDFPDDMALLGIAMTIASGLYILVREEKLRRIQAIETPAE